MSDREAASPRQAVQTPAGTGEERALYNMKGAAMVASPRDLTGGAQAPATAGGPRLLRYGLATSTVALYVGLGFLLRPDANTYLLLGMPITLLFQRLVARRPLLELWLRDGQALRVDRWTAVWLVLFLVGPVQALAEGVRSGNPPVAGYGLAALLGAVGAALAFRALGPSTLRGLGLLIVLMVPLGLLRVLLQLAFAGAGGHDLALLGRLGTEVQSLLFYVPAVFVVEEVFFRGALDSYLHRGQKGAGWMSAAFVSVLWGLWHTPIAGAISAPIVVSLVVAHLALGLLLSWLWRRTGNLAVPGTVHAVVDAVRNALLY